MERLSLKNTIDNFSGLNVLFFFSVNLNITHIYNIMAFIYYMLGEVNNTDYLFIVVPVSWWDILGIKAIFCPPS